MADRFFRPTSYWLRPELSTRHAEFQVIEFRDQWIEDLRTLRNRLWKYSDDRDMLPVKQLNQLFQAISPGVIAAKGVQADADSAWLYARREIRSDVVWASINSWVQRWTRWDRTEADEADIADVLARLQRDPLRWRPQQVDLAEHTLSPGGTGLPHPRLYQLLPEVLASQLVTHPYMFEDKTLGMRLLSTDKGSELISWPPLEYRAKGRVWHYSGRVRFSVQTVPFSPHFRIHVTTGVRRWMTGQPVPLPKYRAAKVVLDTDLEWLSPAEGPTRLITGVLGYNRKERKYDWVTRSLPTLLPAFASACPDPEELVQDPDKWAAAKHKAFVLHSTAYDFTHEVKVGLSPRERMLLDEWVNDGLHEWLVRTPDLKPALARRSVKPRLRPKNKDAQRDAKQRRLALSAATGGQPLRIELRYQDAPLRSLVITQLKILLNLSLPSAADDTLRWETPELTVELNTQRWGIPLSELPTSGKTSATRRAAQTQAIKDRRALVAGSFTSLVATSTVPLALIELGGKKEFPNTLRDPKFAIRLGCAKADRVSQFVRPVSSSPADAEHRVRSALLDGFRQLGATLVAPHTLDDLLGTELDYLGLWMVRKRSSRRGKDRAHALVAVRVARQGSGFVITGWSSLHGQWLPYPRLLLELAALAEIPGDPTVAPPLARWKNRADQERACEAQIKVLLHRIRNRPTLLIADAYNLRLEWSWLQNGRITKDRLGFGDLPPQRVDLFGPHLRVATVRGEAEEVPQCYVPKVRAGNRTAGHAEGIWEAGDAGPGNRVFVSTGEVPVQGKRARSSIKLTPEPTRPKAPAESGWNPRYLEITIAACLSPEILAITGRHDVPHDEPSALATLVHQLRYADDYSGPLAVPVPARLAQLAGEYVLSAPADDEMADSGEFESEGDPGAEESSPDHPA